MEIDGRAPKTRRALLAAGVGGLGAFAAQSLIRPATVAAVANGNVQLGVGSADTDNDATAETRVNGTTDGQIAFSAVQNGSGVGLYGYSNSGRAVQAIGGGSGTALWGQTTTGSGVVATTTDSTPSTFLDPSHRTGVIGTMGDTTGEAANTDETGVYGYADASPSSSGVVGHSHQGWGVIGAGAVGVLGVGTWGVLGDVGVTSIGVYGNVGAAEAPIVAGGIGVLARAQTTSQVALKVLGKAQFSRSGRTSIAPGSSTKTITMAGVTTSSYIIATLQTNRSGIYVRAVVPAAGTFKIYLNTTVPGTTYIGYLVIN